MPKDYPPIDEKGNYQYPCSFKIGERVILDFGNGFKTTDAYVRTILFTNSKVRFGVFIQQTATTLHNIDSVFLKKYGKEEFIDFGDDNYS